MAIKFFAFFFPTISTFGCFWSQWPTSLAVTSGCPTMRCGRLPSRSDVNRLRLYIYIQPTSIRLEVDVAPPAMTTWQHPQMALTCGNWLTAADTHMARIGIAKLQALANLPAEWPHLVTSTGRKEVTDSDGLQPASGGFCRKCAACAACATNPINWISRRRASKFGPWRLKLDTAMKTLELGTTGSASFCIFQLWQTQNRAASLSGKPLRCDTKTPLILAQLRHHFPLSCDTISPQLRHHCLWGFWSGWGGVGWDNNVHVPVRTQALHGHHGSLLGWGGGAFPAKGATLHWEDAIEGCNTSRERIHPLSFQTSSAVPNRDFPRCNSALLFQFILAWCNADSNKKLHAKLLFKNHQWLWPLGVSFHEACCCLLFV